MPRSARLSTAPKRNARRNASKQSSVYDLPESPSKEKNEKSDEDHADDHPIKPATSPIASSPARSRTSSSTAVSTVCDLTNAKMRSVHAKGYPTFTKQPILPGFEALEAVNSLYQQVKDKHSEIVHLNRQNETLSLDLQKQKKMVETLQAELESEKEKSSNIQRNHEKEVHKLRQVSEADLTTILASLRHFSAAAHNLMPLLDILGGATEISYNEDTEKLYQIWNKHKPEALSQ